MKVKASPDGVVVPLLVQPGAGADRVYGEHDGRLKIAVAAPPQKGKANRAVRRLLADRLGIGKSRVRILSGHNSRLKEVFIERVEPGALEAIITS